jgi:uncharacterized membrane protein YhaH (DUF805 family)
MGKYATFSGRATRSEFWWFYLFTTLMYWGASIVSSLNFGNESILSGVGTLITSLVFFLPGIAAGSRRLHDIGRSGWWQLLMLTGVGIFILIIWWALDTKPDTAMSSDEHEERLRVSKLYDESRKT